MRLPCNIFHTEIYHLQLPPLRLSVANLPPWIPTPLPRPPLHCSTVLTRASFIKNTDVAGRTSPGPLFCARSTVERNSIFQGDDVRSANMETGDWEESRCRVAEVAGMFWPHIICCDSSQDNACTWSIWQDVRYRFTLCVGVVRRASVQVKRQNNVMWQEAALQKWLFRAHKPCYHLSQNASLWRIGHPKSLFFSLKNQVVYFLDLFFLFSGVTNTEQHTAYWLILFGFLTRWIFMSPGLQFFIRFHTHAKIQATQADRIIPFNGWEMNRVKYALFYSLIASLGWGNWVPPLLPLDWMNNDFIWSPASLGKFGPAIVQAEGDPCAFQACSVPSVLIFLHFNPPKPPIFLNSSTMNHIARHRGGEMPTRLLPLPVFHHWGVLTATDKSVTLVPVLRGMVLGGG